MPVYKIKGLATNLYGPGGTFWTDDANALGVSTIRVGMWNSTTEEGSTPSAVHTHLSAQGLKVLPLVVDYSTDWTSSAWEAAAVAAVPYADHGIIEIANEPWVGGFGWPSNGHRRPGDYASMVKRCADAVAPYGVKVLAAVGGTGTYGVDYQTVAGPWSQAQSGGGWVNDMVAAEPTILDIVAGVTVHPYHIRPTDASDGRRAMQYMMDYFGWVPLWFTECGRKVQTDYYPNGISNPGFEANASSWAAYDANTTIARSTLTANSGSASLEMNVAVSSWAALASCSDIISYTPGTHADISFAYKAPVTGYATVIGIEALDWSDTVINSFWGNGPTLAPNTSWFTTSIALEDFWPTIPSNTVSIRITIGGQDPLGSNLPVGQKHYIDDVSVSVAKNASSPSMQAEDATTLLTTYLRDNDQVKAVFWYNQADFSAFNPLSDNGWGLTDENQDHRVAWDAYAAVAEPVAPTPSVEPAPFIISNPPVTVRLRTMDGVWEVGGVDRRHGIYPENVKYASDAWGSSKASFDLKREPDAFWPDLRALTPVDIEVGGTLVWSGRIQETPARDTPTDAVINVQCEGWQYHLDDDAYRRLYVSNDTSAWKDTRTMAGFNAYPNFASNLAVENNDGQITLGCPKGETWYGSTAVGVSFDAGPNPDNWIANAYAWVMRSEGAPPNVLLYVRGSDRLAQTGHMSGGAHAGDSVSGATASTISNTGFQVFGTSFPNGVRYRYVHVFFYNNGADYTAGLNDMWFLGKLLLVSNGAYQSSGNSALTADMVVKDAIAKATRNLSSDLSQIAATSFVPPELNMAQHQTAREVISAVNAYHNYETRVDVNKRVVFQPRASTPELTIGRWSNAEIEDASANSSEDMFNRCVVSGNDVADQPILVDRYAGDLASSPLIVPPNLRFTNPNADDSTLGVTGWAVSAGSLTRDTSVYSSSPASLKWDNGGAAVPSTGGGDWGPYADAFFTGGTFKKGVTYSFDLDLRSATDVGGVGATFRWELGVVGVDSSSTDNDPAWSPGAGSQLFGNGSPNVWARMGAMTRFRWTPKQDWDASQVRLRIEFYPQGTNLINAYFDNLTLYQSVPSLLDRQGTTRTKALPVQFALDQSSGKQIADIFLDSHRTTPFKGSVKVYGEAAARSALSGKAVPYWLLPLYGGKLLRLDDRIDPDTGGLGRDARLAEVEVDLNEASASMSLDNSRQNFEALLERLAVVVGSVTR